MKANEVLHSSQLVLSETEKLKVIELGGNTIVGDMLDPNFLENEDFCSVFYIYNGGVYICTVNRNIEVIE